MGNQETVIKYTEGGRSYINGVYIEDGGILHTGNTGYPYLSANNLTIKNSRAIAGGAIYSEGHLTQLEISNFDFSNNIAGGGGAIASNEYVYITLSNGKMLSNEVSVNGGAIYNAGDMYIRNVYISGNKATASGGGVALFNNGYFDATNVLVSGNLAEENGGGIYNVNGRTSLTNVTIAGNYAAIQGRGIYSAILDADQSTELNVKNSIIWGNMASSYHNINQQIYSNSYARFWYSLLEGSGGSSRWNNYYGTNMGNNIDGNPKFINYKYATSTTPTTAGYFRQFPGGSGSIVIDAGNNAFNYLSTDIRGRARKAGNVIDMGAYERINDLQDLLEEPNEIFYPSIDLLSAEGNQEVKEKSLLQKAAQEELRIYPNPIPNSGTVTVELQVYEGMKIEIYTMTGSKIDELTTTGQITTIQAPETKGNYLIKLVSYKGEFIGTKKLVVM